MPFSSWYSKGRVAAAACLVLIGCGGGLALPSSTRLLSASVGFGHACALTDGDLVECWGDNRRSQVSAAPGGVVFGPTQALPVPMTVSAVFTGGDASCASTSLGDITCWGDSLHSTWTLGRTADFVEVKPGEPTCAVTTTGAVLCWPTPSASPVTIMSGPAHALGVARAHACALLADSTATCWATDPLGPAVAVPGGFKFATLSVGGQHACGIDGSGMARCWGANNLGQLGDGAFTPRDTPTVVHPPPTDTTLTFSRVFAGDTHSCAIGTDRLAYCWGAREGGKDGLGDATTGTGSYNIVPFAVHSSLTWDTLFAGGVSTCGFSGGVLYCWGGNSFGADGALDGQPNAVPVPVSGQLAP